MRNLSLNKLVATFATLLISTVLFSYTFENKINKNINNYVNINSITTNLVNEHFELAKVVTGPTINIQPQNTIKCADTTATIIKNLMAKILILIHCLRECIIM
jgi:ABC-type iron transport system FetAB permease component